MSDEKKREVCACGRPDCDGRRELALGDDDAVVILSATGVHAIMPKKFSPTNAPLHVLKAVLLIEIAKDDELAALVTKILVARDEMVRVQQAVQALEQAGAVIVDLRSLVKQEPEKEDEPRAPAKPILH